MSDQKAELTKEALQTPEGISELNRILNFLLQEVPSDGNDRRVIQGYGTPENNISAGIGSIYMRLDGGASTSLYVKESGTSDTGWVAK